MTTKAIILLAICVVVCASKAVGIKKLRLHREEDVPINWQEVSANSTRAAEVLANLAKGTQVVFAHTKLYDSSQLKSGLLNLAASNPEVTFWYINAAGNLKLLNELTKGKFISAPFVAIFQAGQRKYISGAPTIEGVNQKLNSLIGK